MKDAIRRLVRRVGTFLTELRRRRVYQVAAGYLVLAFAGLQALDILVPMTRLPDGSMPLFLGVAIVGFPIALIMAWIFDVTPTGVERTPERAETVDVAEASGARPEAGPERNDRGANPSPGSPSGAGTVAPPDTPRLDPRTVAVLPFENLSGDVDAEPLVVGLHDDLLVELSRTSALRVISGTSVRAYRKQGHSVSETGTALGAGTVVLGTVRRSGPRVRLNIQMVDAESEANRWAERYDRELTAENLFDLQSELARRIREELRIRLTSEEEARRPSQPTDDLQAYTLYVQGRRQLEAWSGDSIREAVRLFTAAVDTDPGYALAWSGLSDALSLLDWYNYPPVQGAPDALTAARRALELDPDLAEAHASRAIVLISPGVQDAPGSIAELERAIELRPSYAYAYTWVGWVRLLAGDAAAAVPDEEEGVRLDPLSPAARVFLAEALLAAGSYERALTEAARGREMQPSRPLSHLFEGIILHHVKQPEGAVACFDAALERLSPRGTSPTRIQVLAFRAVSQAAAGDRKGAESVLEDATVAADPFCRGLVLAGLGRSEEAMTAFREVERWRQLDTECIRFFYPEALGPVRSSEPWPDIRRSVDRSWGMT